MKRVITLPTPVSITAYSSVCGKKESEGPLGPYFDYTNRDDYYGQETWEKAETEMQKRSVGYLLEKRNIKREDVNMAFGGDLCDQITSTTFAQRDLGMPFVGLYGACSTMSESMAVASCFVGTGLIDNALAGASSHFCTAERQFRTPLAYGGKRTPTAQWTVTGAAHVFLEKEGEGPYITRVCFGPVVDFDIKDANNMGAAMAPAAARTLLDFFSESGTKPEDYDAIFTGDLGSVGSNLLKQLMSKEGVELYNHQDCGLLIFNRNEQNVQSGASGCGCSGCVLATYILPKMKERKLKKVLFMSTGALLSPTTSMQKETIPSIAHLVEIMTERETL